MYRYGCMLMNTGNSAGRDAAHCTSATMELWGVQVPAWLDEIWRMHGTDIMTFVLAIAICGTIYKMVSPEQDEYMQMQRAEAKAKMKAAKRERRQAAADAMKLMADDKKPKSVDDVIAASDISAAPLSLSCPHSFHDQGCRATVVAPPPP